MCLVCIEYSKGKLKINEAIRNISEMKESIGEEHHDEVLTMLQEEQLKGFWDDFHNEIHVDEEYWEKIGFGD